MPQEEDRPRVCVINKYGEEMPCGRVSNQPATRNPDRELNKCRWWSSDGDPSHAVKCDHLRRTQRQQQQNNSSVSNEEWYCWCQEITHIWQLCFWPAREIRGHRDNNQEAGELLATAEALVLIPPSWPAGWLACLVQCPPWEDRSDWGHATNYHHHHHHHSLVSLWVRPLFHRAKQLYQFPRNDDHDHFSWPRRRWGQSKYMCPPNYRLPLSWSRSQRQLG